MKRVLVVCYSQTGQLRECAESLTAPLRESPGVEVVWLDPEPAEPYPFPWGLRAFLSVFPESVLGEPAPLKPLPDLGGGRFDLVVLCYQVWYLSPAIPVASFLRSPGAEVLRGTPVVALCACRNMWQQGWLEVKRLVQARGGRLIDDLVLVDQGPDWSTFYTTPRWLLTGKKEGGPFPPAGVSPRDVAGLRVPGERFRDALLAGGPALEGSVLAGTGYRALTVQRKYLFPERAAKGLFTLWARLIRAACRWRPGLRYPLGLAWFGWLACTLPLLPFFVLAGALLRVLRPGWYRDRVEELSAPSGGLVR